jgi:hypothetical protein
MLLKQKCRLQHYAIFHWEKKGGYFEKLF